MTASKELDDLHDFFTDPNNGWSFVKGDTLLEKMQSLVSEYDDEITSLTGALEHAVEIFELLVQEGHIESVNLEPFKKVLRGDYS